MAEVYKVQEFAELAGVTVRALHHYDRLGLLRPTRTISGYRQYRDRDLERLEQIVALGFLGLPLKQIGALLDRESRSLPDVLRAQRTALEDKRSQLDRAIEAIHDAEKAVQAGTPNNAAVLKKLIEVIEMQNNAETMSRYYNAAGLEKMADRRQAWNPEMQAEVSKAWTDLFRDVEEALDTDPQGEPAKALAARWKALVEAFTQRDPDITEGLAKAWKDRANWPADLKQNTAAYADPRVWDFIRRAGAFDKP